MKIKNFTKFLNSKFKKEISKFAKQEQFESTKKIEARSTFYQRKFGAGIPNFTSFTGFIDSFAIFQTSNFCEILIHKKNLKKFVISQERLKQNTQPLHQAIEALNKNSK